MIDSIKLNEIRTKIDKIEKGKKVIIYGAGEHTRKLLAHTNIWSKDIECLVDQNKTFDPGYGRVYSPSEISRILPDVIVISSFAHQNEIYQYLTEKLNYRGEIISFYEEDDCRPFYSHSNDILPHQFDWNGYYDEAEKGSDYSFQKIKSIIGEDFDHHWNLDVTMDFACGRGRIAKYFYQYAKEFICCDCSLEALLYCANRFSGVSTTKFKYIVSKIDEKLPIPESSVNFIYSWDAMVHFELDVIEKYVSIFSEILKTDGGGFIHHSSYKDMPDAVNKLIWHQNPHSRTYVSAAEVKRVFENNGLKVVKQHQFIWGNQKNGEVLDCITVFKK